jgi:IS30 family transposase
LTIPTNSDIQGSSKVGTGRRPVRQKYCRIRAKVLELSSQGYTQLEISTQLQVDEPTISRDIQYLRQKAQKNLQNHIHEVVPEEYQKCMAGMKSNLKETLDIANSVTDPRVKLQARAIVNDCYKFILDMSTNAGVVSDALKYVERKTEQLTTMQKIDEKIEEMEGEEQPTTNGIF